MILKRDAGSDGLGDEGAVCVQRVCDRVQMVGEYNNNSRNFAKENKLEESTHFIRAKECNSLGAIGHITSCRRLLTNLTTLPHLNFLRFGIRRR